jgi:DUF4097 and DUF4098 domain-containing protein YvlB
MPRFLPLATLLAAATLAGCMNAPGDSSSNKSGGASDHSGDITADASGAHAVNGSIHVPAGQQAGEVATVNGSIHVDPNASLSAAHTVNGGIGMGSGATAETLNTVNGGITLDDHARIQKAVATVNGALTLGDGADVGGALTNVNGSIELKSAHVGGGIRTVNGNIDVGPNSRVEGGILVQKQNGGFFNWTPNRTPRVVIRQGAVVQGDLKFEREVKLYVSDKATIGPVTGATPIRFTGDNPPG